MRTGRLQLGPGGAVVELMDTGEIIKLDNVLKTELHEEPRLDTYGFMHHQPPEYRMTVEARPTARFSYDYDPGFTDAQATDITDVQEIGSGPKLLPEKAGE